jgi:hypothetical protein
MVDAASSLANPDMTVMPEFAAFPAKIGQCGDVGGQHCLMVGNLI